MLSQIFAANLHFFYCKYEPNDCFMSKLNEKLLQEANKLTSDPPLPSSEPAPVYNLLFL